MTLAAFPARLHRRLIALALLAVLPALAVMAYAEATGRRVARDRATRDIVQLTRVLAAQQGAFVMATDRLLQTVSLFPGVREKDPARCSTLLGAVLASHPDLLNVAALESDGGVFCTARADAAALRFGERPWFQRVRRSGLPTVGEYGTSGTPAQTDLVVAEPVHGASGRVLLAVVGSSRLARIGRELDLPPGAVFAMFDRNRLIVARRPEGDRWIGRLAPPPALPSPFTGDKMVEDVGIDGIRRLYVTTAVEAGLDSGLFVTLGIEPRLVYADVDARRRESAAVLGGLVLLALGIALVGGRAVVIRPIETLAAVMTRIAAGDFTARAQLRSRAFFVSELGDAVNAMATALELRERERAWINQRLEASETRYRMLFNHNPRPMWVFDRETLEFLEVNQVATAEYGYSRDEFLAMRLTDIKPSDDIEPLGAILHRPGRHQVQTRHRRRSGQVVDVDVISEAVEFNGRPARLALAVDNTARLRMERQLQEIQERFQFALEASHVGVWEANLRTNRAYWSETSERLHGLRPGAFDGTLEAFLATVHPGDRDAIRATIEAAVRNRCPVEFEYRTVWPDGTEHRLKSTGRFFFDDVGAPARGAGVTIDVSDQRSLEDQYRQAQKMEAVGLLAGGIAHDFNNMLTAILGNAELVLEDLRADDPHRPDLSQIQQSALRAADLTHQLLAFSRKQVLVPRVVNLGSVVGEVAPMLRRLIGESIDLRTVVENRGAIMADASQLEQVVLNLAVNARDAMPTGGRLTIEVRDAMIDAETARQHVGCKAGACVMLAVSDTGHGMDAATQARIFEPFFTTKPKGKGTGLGLSTVYGIVQQSGGCMSVESEVGCGTTFKIFLPRVEEPGEVLADEAPNKSTPRGAGNVLLIEDEDGVRGLIEKVLTRSGYTVYAAARPSAARALLGAIDGTPLHLVISDVVLPEIDGPTFVEDLRRTRPEMKVLYVSGYADPEMVQPGVLDPATTFLPKPFTTDALLDRVHTALAS